MTFKNNNVILQIHKKLYKKDGDSNHKEEVKKAVIPTNLRGNEKSGDSYHKKETKKEIRELTLILIFATQS